MTARLPSEPVRVTSWLAGWVDYVFAIVLVAGRWLRAPISRRDPADPVMLSAFAPTMAETYAPRWHESAPDGDSSSTSGLVKAAEIVMLSVSFFLAAHLLSGGTPTVTAPDLNPLGLLPDHVRAEALPVPSVAPKQVEVPAGTFAFETRPIEPEPTAIAQESAVLAPASAPDSSAAAVAPAATPAPEPTVEAIQPEPVAPPTAPVAAATQAPLPEDPGRYLTGEELHAAALAAGWPAELLPQVEFVARCESSLHTHAENFGAMGLMQVVPLWFDIAGVDPDMWTDPVTNLRAAEAAYRYGANAGVDPWGQWAVRCRPPVD